MVEGTEVEESVSESVPMTTLTSRDYLTNIFFVEKFFPSLIRETRYTPGEVFTFINAWVSPAGTYIFSFCSPDEENKDMYDPFLLLSPKLMEIVVFLSTTVGEMLNVAGRLLAFRISDVSRLIV